MGTDPDHVDIDLLGILYRFSSNSPRWVALIHELWRPFVVREQAAPMFTWDLHQSGSDLILRLPGLDPLELDAPWPAINAIKYSLVEHALKRAPAVLAVHAAFLEKSGERVLLVGASGAGKTTLSVQLLEQGWAYGSDDLAPLIVGETEILPFPRALALRDVEIWDRYLPRWKAPSWLPRPTGPCQIPASVFPLMSPCPIAPTHIFFIDPDHTVAPELRRLSRAFATAQLSQYVRWFREHDLASLAKLGRVVTSWGLRYRTAAQGADQVARACSGEADP